MRRFPATIVAKSQAMESSRRGPERTRAGRGRGRRGVTAPRGLSRIADTKKPGKLWFSRLLVTLKLVGETGFEPATSTSRT